MKPKTKEQILAEICDMPLDWFTPAFGTLIPASQAMEAMQEFAELEAIAFGAYLGDVVNTEKWHEGCLDCVDIPAEVAKIYKAYKNENT